MGKRQSGRLRRGGKEVAAPAHGQGREPSRGSAIGGCIRTRAMIPNSQKPQGRRTGPAPPDPHQNRRGRGPHGACGLSGRQEGRRGEQHTCPGQRAEASSSARVGRLGNNSKQGQKAQQQSSSANAEGRRSRLCTYQQKSGHALGCGRCTSEGHAATLAAE